MSNGDVAAIELSVSGDFTITKNFLTDGWQMFEGSDKILILNINDTKLPDHLFSYDGELIINANSIMDWETNEISAAVIDIPPAFVLNAAYPNPFNPTTLIEYGLSTETFVTITVYDMLGREVVQLVNEVQPSGKHSTLWNANGFASGIYFLKMTSGDFIATQKLILMR